MKKIGLYGGTFDPVHHGHLILARDAVEKLGLDRLLFVPAALSPHKPDQQPAPPEVRLAMLKAAIADEPAFEIDDQEMRRPPPSYTIDTVHSLKKRFPGCHLFLLIGEDNLDRLSEWKDVDLLLSECTPVALARSSGDVERFHLHLPRRLHISATEIRKRVAKGLSIRYFLPESVMEIIQREKLYQEELRPSKPKL